MVRTEREKEIINHSQSVESNKRTNATIIIEVLLRPTQINQFKFRLEELKREFFAMSEEDDDIIVKQALPMIEKRPSFWQRIFSKKYERKN